MVLPAPRKTPKCNWSLKVINSEPSQEAVFGGTACTTWASASLNSLWTLAIIKYYYSESHSLFCYFPCSIWFYFLSAGWIRQRNTPVTLSTHSPFKVGLGKQYIMFSAWMPVERTNGRVSVHSTCTEASSLQNFEHGKSLFHFFCKL